MIARSRLFEAVARLGQALAAPPREPVVLFVDDVHCADSGSLNVLRYVARRWAGLKVSALVLLNARSEALASDQGLGEWLVGLGSDLPMTHITLASLGPEDTEELLRSCRTSAGVIERGAPMIAVGRRSWRCYHASSRTCMPGMSWSARLGTRSPWGRSGMVGRSTAPAGGSSSKTAIVGSFTDATPARLASMIFGVPGWLSRAVAAHVRVCRHEGYCSQSAE
jgi:hypothetical protein